ncbi:hypothetical protein NEISICOT_03713 [Neisseria sicca ATCC 29256]|uniref:Uncharacterized protein n=1 Tax=Neisseria sicca ATCC 29256 TaxID=547045 RepID=C6MAY1_NEISI|nr:hypothetical protein NEISICOT_03713 [Neisseria sicca ATCC 29256]
MGRISGYLKRNSRKPVLGFRLSEEGLFCKRSPTIFLAAVAWALPTNEHK